MGGTVHAHANNKQGTMRTRLCFSSFCCKFTDNDELAVVVKRTIDNATRKYMVAQPLKNELKPSI